MNTRRAILRLIGAVPAATASARAELASFAASPAVAAAVSAVGVQSNSAAASSTYGLLPPLIGKQLRRLQQDAETEIWARRNARTNGLDPDIACLRSMSAVNKVRKQVERDRTDADLLSHVQRMFWNE